ncbi:MAG: hypothetical protein K0S39_2193 [Paenibacillus sp.]|jgi:hypothetical protein|nr:hypothetical protein [Paenibacillus sp.]
MRRGSIILKIKQGDVQHSTPSVIVAGCSAIRILPLEAAEKKPGSPL